MTETTAPAAGTPDAAQGPDRPTRRRDLARITDGLAVIALLALAFLIAAFAATDSQVWLDLAAGRGLADGTYSLGSDPFTSTGQGRTWVNHSWLYDVSLYALYDGEGGAALVIAKAVLVVLLVGLPLTLNRPGMAVWPWVAVGSLGVIAAAPFLDLTPSVVSYLFFGVALWMLAKLPARRGSKALPVAFAVLCALWANLDEWFVLGPAVMAVALLGHVLHPLITFADQPEEESPDDADWRTLAVALLAGAAATLLNPHHVGVWQIPGDLLGTPVRPYDREFFSSAVTGNPLNAVAYLLLLAAAAVALGLNNARQRGRELLVWVVLALGGILSVQMVPFFAAAAVPFAARNFQEFFATPRLPGRPGRVLGGVGLGLTAAGAFVLAAAAFPGWLNRGGLTGSLPTRSVDPGLVPDRSLKQAAAEFAAWGEAGKLKEVRGVAESPAVGDYMAWFAPGGRSFFNSRPAFHAPEYEVAAKVTAAAGSRRPTDGLATLLDETDADYLVLHTAGPVGDRRAALVARLWTARKWRAWYVDGRTAVVAGASAGGPGPIDVVARAFADAEPVPAPEQVQGPLAQRTFWDKFFGQTLPREPLECSMDRVWAEYLRRRYLQAGVLSARRFCLAMAAGGPAAGLLPSGPSRAEVDAAALLKLRNARRAILAEPDHYRPYYDLAQAYSGLAAQLSVTGDRGADGGLSRYVTNQGATAALRCLGRLSPAGRATAAESKVAFRSATLLIQFHFYASRYESALLAAAAGKQYAEAAPETYEAGKGREWADFENLRTPTGQPLTKLVGQALGGLRAALGQGASAVDRATVAMNWSLPVDQKRRIRFPLTETAAAAADEALNSETLTEGLAAQIRRATKRRPRPKDLRRAELLFNVTSISLTLDAGRAEQAADLLAKQLGEDDPAAAITDMNRILRGKFSEILSRADAALGRYGRAATVLESIAAVGEPEIKADRDAWLQFVGPKRPRVAGNERRYILNRIADYARLRLKIGMIHLEAGQIAEAEKNLREAVFPLGEGRIGYPGQEVAARLLAHINRGKRQ